MIPLKNNLSPTGLKALAESIEHWKRLASGNRQENENPRGTYCALCVEYWEKEAPSDEDGPSNCYGCPIWLRTKYTECSGTPFYPAFRAYQNNGLDSPEFKTAAKTMLEYLEQIQQEETAE